MSKKSSIEKVEPAIRELFEVLDQVSQQAGLDAVREEVERVLKNSNQEAFNAFRNVMAESFPEKYPAEQAARIIGKIDSIALVREGYDLNVYILYGKEKRKVISNSDGGGVISHYVSRTGLIGLINRS